MKRRRPRRPHPRIWHDRSSALRGGRHRLEHDPRARRRAAGGPAAQGDGAARLHADRQGRRSARARSPPRRSPSSPRSSPPRCGSPRSSAPRRSGSSPPRRSARPRTATQVGARDRRARPASRSRSSARRRRAGSRSSARPRPSGIRSRARSASSTSAAARPRSSSARSPRASARCARSRSAPARSPRSSSTNDPPSAAEIRALRDHIDDFFDGVEVDQPDQAVAVGGSATSLRDAGRRGARVRDARARRSACSPATRSPRWRSGSSSTRGGCGSCRPGVLILEKLSELLGQPLQIGKGGLREGVILDLLSNGASNGAPQRLAAYARLSGVRLSRMAKARPIPGLGEDDSVLRPPPRRWSRCAPRELAEHAARRARHGRHRARARHAGRDPAAAGGARGLRALLSAQALQARRCARSRSSPTRSASAATATSRSRRSSEFAEAGGRPDRPGVESLDRAAPRASRPRRTRRSPRTSPTERLDGARASGSARLVEPAAAKTGDGPSREREAVPVEQIPAPLSAPPVPAGAGASNGAGER